MPPTIRLDHRGPITLSSALRKNGDVINQAVHLAATEELGRVLCDSRTRIESLARHHLRLRDRDSCIVAPCNRWIRGGFNVCVPVETRSGGVSRRLMFRCPMPHKLAEARYPVTLDEKLSCEVGTYAWMQDSCPDIRIPHLYGFGFSDHRHVSPLDLTRRCHLPTDPSLDSSPMSGNCRSTLVLASDPTPPPPPSRVRNPLPLRRPPRQPASSGGIHATRIHWSGYRAYAFRHMEPTTG